MCMCFLCFTIQQTCTHCIYSVVNWDALEASAEHRFNTAPGTSIETTTTTDSTGVKDTDDDIIMSAKGAEETTAAEATTTTKSGNNSRSRKKKSDDPRMRAARNDPCPCGSCKRYRKCCMKVDLGGKVVLSHKQRKVVEAEMEYISGKKRKEMLAKGDDGDRDDDSSGGKGRKKKGRHQRKLDEKEDQARREKAEEFVAKDLGALTI